MRKEEATERLELCTAYQLNDSIYQGISHLICVRFGATALIDKYQDRPCLRDQEREYKNKLLLASLHAATGAVPEAIDVLEEVRREDLPASLTRDYYACKGNYLRDLGNSPWSQSITPYEE
ncbi:MAG: hypothetical protein ACLR6J_07765 [Parabacteroides merdae]